MADLTVQPPRFKKVRQYNLGYLSDPPIERTYDMAALQITPEQLKERLDRGDHPMILDVREPSEQEIVNIGGTLIPLGQLPRSHTNPPTPHPQQHLIRNQQPHPT